MILQKCHFSHDLVHLAALPKLTRCGPRVNCKNQKYKLLPMLQFHTGQFLFQTGAPIYINY